MPDIKGYRELSDDEKALINSMKELAEQVGEAVSYLEENAFVDRRWVAIGKTHLQQGFMALVRAVAQPTTF